MEKRTERWGGELFLFERCRAEAEVVFWLKALFEATPSAYELKSDNELTTVLADVKGFRRDPLQHRVIAESFQKGDDCKEEEVEEEEEEKSNILAFLPCSKESTEDVGAVVLNGVASFVSLSDRLRSDVWGQWELLIQAELDAVNSSQLKLSVGEEASHKVLLSSILGEDPGSDTWKGRRTTLFQCKKEIEGVINNKRFAVGSFSRTLLNSDALEITAKSIIGNPPKEETFEKYTAILALLFRPQHGYITAVLKAIKEISDLEGVLKNQKADCYPKFLEKSSSTAWNLMKTGKNFHQIFTLGTEAATHIEDLQNMLNSLRPLMEKWRRTRNPSKNMKEDIWEAFLFFDEFYSVLHESDLSKLADLACENSEKTRSEIVKEMTELIDLVSNAHKANQIKNLRDRAAAVSKLMKLLAQEQEQLTEQADSLEKGTLLHESHLGSIDDAVQEHSEKTKDLHKRIDKRYTRYMEQRNTDDESDCCPALQELQVLFQKTTFPQIMARACKIRSLRETLQQLAEEAKEIAMLADSARYEGFRATMTYRENKVVKDAYESVERLAQLTLKEEGKRRGSTSAGSDSSRNTPGAGLFKRFFG